MPKRRMGTIPQRVRLTQQTSDRIDAYQVQHNIPSFSATIETLVRLGLEQSPGEVLAPIIVSTLRREFNAQVNRLAKLLAYNIVETGQTRLIASAALRDIGRLKQDDPERHEKIKEAARKEARHLLDRKRISQLLDDLDWKQDETTQPPSECTLRLVPRKGCASPTAP